MSTKVQRFSSTGVERQRGEAARLRVLKGLDQGSVFIIKDASVILGRGDEADVRVADLKTSRSHARLDFTKNGWTVSDLGSANGVYFNGEFTRKFTLKTGDYFTLGDTIFEFIEVNELTKALAAPIRSGVEVVQQEKAMASQRARVQTYAKSPVVSQGASGNAKKLNPRTLLLLAGLGAAYFFMDQEEPAPQPATKKEAKNEKNSDDRGLASYLAGSVSKEVAKTAEQYYKQGFREYREHNFLRAKTQFELALQVNPSHQLARHYLKSAEKDIELEIQKMIRSAQKEIVAGRYREAKNYYQAAMRLMYVDKSNPDYIECEEAIKKIDDELGRESL